MKNLITYAFFPVLVCTFAADAICQPISFTNYGSNRRVENDLWPGKYHIGPWTWFARENGPAPFWSASVSFVETTELLGPPSVDEEGIFRRPFNGKMVVEARSDEDPDVIIGTMVFTTAEPSLVIGDLNPARTIVDEQLGMSYTRWGSFLLSDGQPFVTYVLEKETGVFAKDNITLVGEQKVFVNTLLAAPLGFEQLTPDVVVGGFSEWVWTGNYEVIPEPCSLHLMLAAMSALMMFRRRHVQGSGRKRNRM